MALIICSECGNRVSEYASMCPVCGNPVEKKRYCPVCNNEIEKDSAFCRKCGTRVAPPNVNTQMAPPQIIQQPVTPQTKAPEEEETPSNGVGTTGMVLSICGAALVTLSGMDVDDGSLALVGIILLVPAFILSLIGIFRRPKAKAIVGLILSAIILMCFLVGLVGMSAISEEFIL